MPSFLLKCIPPKSTAQQRKLFRAGNGRTYFAKDKNAKAAESDLLTLLMPYRPLKPMEGPLTLSIGITWPWRKSEPQKNRIQSRWHDKKPDLDNFAKTFIDCMTRLGFFVDDSQVACLCMMKHWGDEPGIRVDLKPLLKGDAAA